MLLYYPPGFSPTPERLPMFEVENEIQESRMFWMSALVLFGVWLFPREFSAPAFETLEFLGFF